MKIFKIGLYILLIPFSYAVYAAGSDAADTSSIVIEKACVNGTVAAGNATVSDSINNPTLSSDHVTVFSTNDAGATLWFTDTSFDKGGAVTLSETSEVVAHLNNATESESGTIAATYRTNFTGLNTVAEGTYDSTITATCAISS